MQDMPEVVSKERINEKVVRYWSRLMEQTAKDRGDNLSIVRPFHCREETYDSVMQEVRSGTPRGVELYRSMVAQLPWYQFEE